MAITDWPEGERPREKLLAKGGDALSDAELLAVFLRVGAAGKSAVDLARELLLHFDGSLNRLFAASAGEFTSIKGMGPAKYAQLHAVWVLARRALAEKMGQGDVLSSPNAVREYLRLTLSGQLSESFWIVYLDSQNRARTPEQLFSGSLTQAAVYPREVVKKALAHNAAAVILAHNHPSGVAEPSSADRALTENLRTALALIEVRVLDHFVIAGNHITSFAERGLL
jgi:DNA repair protein RadC